MSRSNTSFVISFIAGIIIFAAISKFSKKDDFEPKMLKKARGSTVSQDMEVIESTFIESRELVHPDDSTHTANHYKISNYNAITETSAMQKFKKMAFPDWLILASMDFGRRLAFWKDRDAEARNGRSLANYKVKIDKLENFAMGAGVVAGILITIGVIILRTREANDRETPKPKINTV